MAEHDQSSSGLPADSGTARAEEFGGEYVSEEVALVREQSVLDRIDPAWDFSSRITTARGALKRGMPVDMVRKAYGETVLAAAIEPER